jgi:amidophosphoribosyltransferase
MDKLREECGVFGVCSPARGDLARLAYYGLYALQHRGQESAGIAVNDDGVFRAWKDTGLVTRSLPRTASPRGRAHRGGTLALRHHGLGQRAHATAAHQPPQGAHGAAHNGT